MIITQVIEVNTLKRERFELAKEMIIWAADYGDLRSSPVNAILAIAWSICAPIVSKERHYQLGLQFGKSDISSFDCIELKLFRGWLNTMYDNCLDRCDYLDLLETYLGNCDYE